MYFFRLPEAALNFYPQIGHPVLAKERRSPAGQASGKRKGSMLEQKEKYPLCPRCLVVK